MSSPVTHSPLPPAHALENRPPPRARSASSDECSPQFAQRAAQLVARLPVSDGLRICLSLADERSPYFSSAALRCHSRLLATAPELSLSDAQTALAALAGLRRPHRYAAAQTLREIYAGCGEEDAAEVLDAWLMNPPCSTRAGGPTGAHARVDLEVGA